MNQKLRFLCFPGIHNSLPSFWPKLGFSRIKIDHIADSLLKLQIKIGVHLINVELSQLLGLTMYSLMLFSFRQVHNDYKNGRQNRFDQIKKIFYYKSNLIWSNQGKGLTMETFHKDDGYSLHTLESNLKLDTQVLSMSLPRNSNYVWNLLVLFDSEINKIILTVKVTNTLFR
jgi:hypothetical protein